MTDRNAVARMTRLSFSTDMTRPTPRIITLGFMIEAAWPDAARWLGLVARTRLRPDELGQINLMTWPELKNPPELMDEIFNNAWEGPWGDAGATIGHRWGTSALLTSTEDVHSLIVNEAVDTAAGWVRVTDVLRASLEFYGTQLEPVAIEPATRKPLRAPDTQSPLLSIPSRDTRTRTDFRLAA